MQPIRKPTWQQATALVSLSTCGAMTGFAFAHGSVDEMTSPTRMPVHLVAVSEPDRPSATAESHAAFGDCGRREKIPPPGPEQDACAKWRR